MYFATLSTKRPAGKSTGLDHEVDEVEKWNEYGHACDPDGVIRVGSRISCQPRITAVVFVIEHVENWIRTLLRLVGSRESDMMKKIGRGGRPSLPAILTP